MAETDANNNITSTDSLEDSLEKGQLVMDESGSALDDAKLGAVIAGGVVAAGMKVAPKKYRKKYKACQKKLRVFVKRWKEKHPVIMSIVKSFGIISGGVLTYLDLITDINATDAMYQAGRSDWALIMIILICIPIFIAMVGIVLYMHKSHPKYVPHTLLVVAAERYHKMQQYH